MGSVVVELYTLTYPQNVKSLLLLSPFYGQILNLGSFELGIPLAALAPLLPFLINGDAASFDSAFIDIGLPETCPSRKEVKNFLMNLGSKSPASIQLAVLGAQNPPTPADQPTQLGGTLNPFCSPPAVPQINVPTLIIYGGQDLLTNRQGIEALRQAIPNSQLYEVPGGHFITVTQSEKVDRAIFSFLMGNSSTCYGCF